MIIIYLAKNGLKIGQIKVDFGMNGIIVSLIMMRDIQTRTDAGDPALPQVEVVQPAQTQTTFAALSLVSASLQSSGVMDILSATRRRMEMGTPASRVGSPGRMSPLQPHQIHQEQIFPSVYSVYFCTATDPGSRQQPAKVVVQ